jgi:flagellar biogenesis protein FliO
MQCTWRISQRFLSVVCLGGLLLVLTQPTSHAAELETPRPSDREATQTVQERFLQQFISQSLQPETAPQSTAAVAQTVPDTTGQPPLAAPSPLVGQEEQARQLTSAATKMVLALGILVILLIGGAYLVRRYLLQQTSFGKRGQLLRVIAKVPLTPKASVALIEVPGKIFVVGVAGTMLAALGEVSPEAIGVQEQEPEAPLSFAVALDQGTRDLEQQGADESLRRVTETIRKKVSGLKRL